MRQPRLKIAVPFGGRSAEHDVSVLSATNVMAALSAEKYEPMPIFVTWEGQWLLSRFEKDVLPMPESGTEVALVPVGRGRLILFGADGQVVGTDRIDMLFPVLHGLFGEDGSVQGLAEVARFPLAGCGLLGSATALDKAMAKRLCARLGFRWRVRWPSASATRLILPLSRARLACPSSSSLPGRDHRWASGKSRAARNSNRRSRKPSALTASSWQKSASPPVNTRRHWHLMGHRG